MREINERRKREDQQSQLLLFFKTKREGEDRKRKMRNIYLNIKVF